MNMDEKKVENGTRALANDELDSVNGGVGLSADNVRQFVKIAGELKDKILGGENKE